MQKRISISTSAKYELVDITGKVKEVVAHSGIKRGICSIYVPHATAAITINENADPNVKKDILNALEKLVPEGRWLHDKVDNNAAAHIKASIIGPSESIPIEGSELMLGTWQDIFLCDFDGPKNRNIILTMLEDTGYRERK
ncbi:YjbQ family protein [Candidatus Woesearchaeota archaeon]|nr:YjbQ family protein [Candidatus Woesearchaeota archaeon]